MIVAALVLSLTLPGAAFARRPTTPVVVVVFDELPMTSLLARSGRIDRFRYPNFAALARRSTWYANATTVSDSTRFAIPAILDGRAPRRHLRPTAAAHPNNLFTLLHGRGYALHVEEEATDLCPYSNCRRRFGARYFLVHDRLERFRAWVRRIEPGRRPMLAYKHTLLPHAPWTFLPSGQRFDRTVLGPITGLNSSGESAFDPTLVRQTWQRHLLQVGTADRLLGELVARLRKTRLFHRSIIVVTSDHGVSFRDGAIDGRTIVPQNAGDIAPIPLFIKYPHQRRGRIARGLVRSSDVLPTVAARIGLSLPRGLGGRPASSRAVGRRRRVAVLSLSGPDRVAIDRRELTRLKQSALARKVALFGRGPRTLFDFGPNRDLRGRLVALHAVDHGGPVKASLNEAAEYERIRPDATFLPVHITGTITGGPSGSRRDVAVALDGVIQGASRSVRLRGGDAEYFSVLVDPEALRRGRNDVQVFTVSRTPADVRLRRIYRSSPAGSPVSPKYPKP